jgi:hypothetical protein
MEAYVNDPPSAAPAKPEKETEPMKQTTEIEPKGPKLARARKALKTAKAKAPKIRKAKPAKVKEAKPRGTIIKFRGEVRCKAGAGQAQGRMTCDGLLVLAGSQAVKKVNKSVQEKTPSRFKTRNDLIKDGTLKKDGKFLVFTHNFLFSNPTVAACTVQGGSSNGMVSWKDAETGKTLKELA